MAHHSFAAHYDLEKRVTLTGVVTSFDYRSPHSFLHMDVTGADQTKQSWTLEFGSALALNRQGWNRGTFKPGDVVQAVGMPARSGALRINVAELRREADGFVFIARPGAAGAPGTDRGN
jgi:hypothetical protein